MSNTPFEFVAPSEASLFNQTWEEFNNPLIYIEKIKSIAERTGILKIIPPPVIKLIKIYINIFFIYIYL